MGDDISLGSVCFGFCRGAAVHFEKEWTTILKDILSLNPNRCHHPLE